MQTCKEVCCVKNREILNAEFELSFDSSNILEIIFLGKFPILLLGQMKLVLYLSILVVGSCPLDGSNEMTSIGSSEPFL